MSYPRDYANMQVAPSECATSTMCFLHIFTAAVYKEMPQKDVICYLKQLFCNFSKDVFCIYGFHISCINLRKNISRRSLLEFFALAPFVYFSRNNILYFLNSICTSSAQSVIFRNVYKFFIAFMESAFT